MADMYANNNFMGGYQGYQQYPNMYSPQQPVPGYYDPAAMYGYGNPVVMGNIPQGRQTNIFTPEEEKIIQGQPKKDILDLNIDSIDGLLCTCEHATLASNPGITVLKECMDGSGDVYCEVCKKRFPKERIPIEALEEADRVKDAALQQMKLMQILPKETTREISKVNLVDQKLTALYKYVMDVVDKQYNGDWFNNAQMIGSNYMFDVLRNSAGGIFPGSYPQMQYPQMQYQQPIYGQPQVATTINPMQAPIGINPLAPNQQFVGQTGMMMNGGIPTNPYAQQQNVYAPAPMTQQPVQQAVQQPMQQPVQQQTVYKPNNVNAKPNTNNIPDNVEVKL